MERLIYSLVVRGTRMPGIKNLAKKLYGRFCSKSVLTMSEARMIDNQKKLSPRPAGSVFWTKGGAPSWDNTPPKYDLSVIIPFYKTEQYAHQVIQSVLDQQSEYKYELILVNDGSPDKCGEILDSYSTYDHVRVIHRQNGGLSAARNTGILAAEGRYLMFVDSDDVLCAGAIQALMQATINDNVDIVEGAFSTMTLEGITKRHYPHREALGRKGEGMRGYACGKIFRRELFTQVCFPEGYWFEDTIVASLLHPRASVTKTISNTIFLYRTNPKGITANSKTNPKCIDSYYIVEEILQASQHLGVKVNARGMLRQLGTYLYGRVHTIPEEQVQTLFLMAAELVEKYDLGKDISNGSYYEQCLYEAFVNRQYERWKWASILM